MKKLIFLLSFVSATLTSESNHISNFRTRSSNENLARKKRFTDWETMIMRTRQMLKNDDDGIKKMVKKLENVWSRKISPLIPLRSKKTRRFEKLLGFSRSHTIVTRHSVSLSYASISQSQRYFILNPTLNLFWTKASALYLTFLPRLKLSV